MVKIIRRIIFYMVQTLWRQVCRILSFLKGIWENKYFFNWRMNCPRNRYG